MKKLLLIIFAIGLISQAPGQTNILLTQPLTLNVMQGNYNPGDYAASTVISHPDSIIRGMLDSFSEDSLRSYLEILSGFDNRNTGSDTVSATFGIGAARRWAFQKFKEFSAANDDRLIPGYLQFDRPVCAMQQHRNVLAVLPGADTSNADIVLIEAHMDSRCDNYCDVNCIAHGADDNGSGSVLVMELARVLSKFTFDHTLVFMLTTGEEQGLFGAEAFAEFAGPNGIGIKAVLNNDVIGGIICGNTASAPGCPGAGDIDSLNVRIYSQGNFNSPHKGLARFIKLQYQEELMPFEQVPVSVNIMTGEDRSGRGGDHIPFRRKGFSAIRFTSANEHGNGAPGPGYVDHQHTSEDSIGVDTDNDGIIDSLWVDFNYLGRNARINGCAAAMAAIGPDAPTYLITPVPEGIAIKILTGTPTQQYRVGIRTVSHDFDTLYTISGPDDTIRGLMPGGLYLVSIASLDSLGIESLFSYETNASVPTSSGLPTEGPRIELLPNRPNPFDEKTTISVWVSERIPMDSGVIRVTDVNGKLIRDLSISLEPGLNSVDYYHGFHASGVFLFSLFVDEKPLATKRMIFNGR